MKEENLYPTNNKITTQDFFDAVDFLKSNNHKKSIPDNVYLHPNLPIDETVSVCDINTREEFKIMTGKKIHVFTTDKGFFVSNDAYEKFKSFK